MDNFCPCFYLTLTQGSIWKTNDFIISARDILNGLAREERGRERDTNPSQKRIIHNFWAEIIFISRIH